MRLIDAETLEDIIYKFYCRRCRETGRNWCRGCKVYNILGFMKRLCGTVEAKPVVHAHWEKYDDSEFCYCSHCGKPAAEDDDVSWHGYCPVCGAQMDEGVKIPVISMEDVPKLMEEMEK